jgi:hypothetical protein
MSIASPYGSAVNIELIKYVQGRCRLLTRVMYIVCYEMFATVSVRNNLRSCVSVVHRILKCVSLRAQSCNRILPTFACKLRKAFLSLSPPFGMSTHGEATAAVSSWLPRQTRNAAGLRNESLLSTCRCWLLVIACVGARRHCFTCVS